MSWSPSYWEKTSFLESPDLVIVGAGIVGLSTALFYKKNNPDARVMVLDRGFLPKGASTRNAGFACVGSIGEHLADLEKSSESEVKDRIKLRYNGLQLLKKTLGEEPIDYDPCGGYEFFKSQEDFEKVAPHIDRFNGWMEELINEDDVYKASKVSGYPVIANRLEGALHPGKMMQHLVKKVENTGVEIKWNSEVTSFGKNGELRINDDITLHADKILLAANGFARRLLRDLEISPARGFVFVTDEQDDMPWKGIFHHDEGYVYFRNIGSRLLIGGARNLDKKAEETDHFGVNKEIKEHLTHFVSDTLKLSDRWNIDHEWSGIMGFTNTKTPIIKKIDNHRLVAAGLSGMGIAIGMQVGQRAAKMI